MRHKKARIRDQARLQMLSRCFNNTNSITLCQLFIVTLKTRSLFSNLWSHLRSGVSPSLSLGFPLNPSRNLPHFLPSLFFSSLLCFFKQVPHWFYSSTNKCTFRDAIWRSTSLEDHWKCVDFWPSQYQSFVRVSFLRNHFPYLVLWYSPFSLLSVVLRLVVSVLEFCLGGL